MHYKDGYLYDDKNIVMPSWELPIMKQAAKTICKNGGRVLNIGFGLGIIDSFIQKENIEEHWIIESNPVVIEKMKLDGWYDKPNVTIIEGDWKTILPIKDTLFDGIYYDTWKSGGQKDLVRDLYINLKVNGHFGFWCAFDKYRLKKWKNIFKTLGYSTFDTSIYLPEGTEEEHYNVFGRDISRKYTALYAKRIKEAEFKLV